MTNSCALYLPPSGKQGINIDCQGAVSRLGLGLFLQEFLTLISAEEEGNFFLNHFPPFHYHSLPLKVWKESTAHQKADTFIKIWREQIPTFSCRHWHRFLPIKISLHSCSSRRLALPPSTTGLHPGAGAKGRGISPALVRSVLSSTFRQYIMHEL